MRIACFITLSTLLLGFVGCDEQEIAIGHQDESEPSTLGNEEQRVLRALLQAYSYQDEEGKPPVLSSHIGVGVSAPQGIENLQLDYDQELTPRYVATIASEPPEWLFDPVLVMSNEVISEALDSLVQSNEVAVEADVVVDLHTVPVRHLNDYIANYPQVGSDEFWTAFDSMYPRNAGFSTASRVGFSRDGSVAVVYFSWTGGPDSALGAIHVLTKENDQWQLIGAWRSYGWTS